MSIKIVTFRDVGQPVATNENTVNDVDQNKNVL